MFKQLLKLFITKEIFHFAELNAGLEAELALFPSSPTRSAS